MGRDDGKACEAKPLLVTPVDVLRRNIADYYPNVIVFDAACLHSPPLVGPAVPVSASSWALASTVSTVDHPVMFTGPTDTVISPLGSLAVTIAAPQVFAAVPPLPPAIPTSATEAYEALLGTCQSVSVTGLKGVVEALTAAQARFRRSLRYASLVGRTQEVKEALEIILEENAMVLSTSMAANMDDRFGLKLTDAEDSCIVSFALGPSSTSKRALVGPSACPSS